MNKRQIAAANQLEKALAACHKTGLVGGVFGDGYCFQVWPGDAKPSPFDVGDKFFERIREIGRVIITPMQIDGGSGV